MHTHAGNPPWAASLAHSHEAAKPYERTTPLLSCCSSLSHGYPLSMVQVAPRAIHSSGVAVHTHPQGCLKWLCHEWQHVRRHPPCPPQQCRQQQRGTRVCLQVTQLPTQRVHHVVGVCIQQRTQRTPIPEGTTTWQQETERSMARQWGPCSSIQEWPG